MTLPSSTDRLVPQDLVMFHGGRIVGPVELRPRAKSMAYGPGFYLTTWISWQRICRDSRRTSSHDAASA